MSYTETLSLSKLRSFFSYDPETGEFRHLRVLRGITNGSVAGTQNSLGYIYITIDGRKYLAHRLAWFYVNGVWPELEIDHANGNPSDNRIVNLRIASSQMNNANSKKKPPRSPTNKNRSIYKGVYFHEGTGKWRAAITFNKKTRHLGLFSREDEAGRAYLVAARSLFGEFARAA